MSYPVNILVVDDEKDVELLFRQHFRRETKKGVLELDFAFSGDEAIAKLEGTIPPDVVYVFSDINMPGMTGIELLEIIRNKFPNIQVSMISAYGDSEFQDKAYEFGADKFFIKPIDFKSLKEKVNHIIESNQQ